MNNDQLSGLAGFRRYFWQPPRAHGQVIEDRSVSFLELFYDLVYVVVVAQASHHLASNVTWVGTGEFAVVFGLIWIAWVNGSVYHDLHGRGDGRSRMFVFSQMAILALLAVFTDDATGADGAAFAVVYSVFLVVLTWLWYSVTREDDEEYRRTTTPYLVGMLVSIAVMVSSIFMADQTRTLLWGALVVVWAVGVAVFDRVLVPEEHTGDNATDSIIERFGLFTIIVLGEVVVGVVEGIADASRTKLSIVTGMIGLVIGFAYWWTYFDFVGGRRIRRRRGAFSTWVLGHFPVTMTIAATGAGMVSLIEHASDGRSPAGTAWLLSGSVSVGLIALVAVISTLEDSARLRLVYRPLSATLVVAAVLALAVGAARPAPWLLALLLVTELNMIWFIAILRWLAHADPDEAIPALDRP